MTSHASWDKCILDVAVYFPSSFASAYQIFSPDRRAARPCPDTRTCSRWSPLQRPSRRLSRRLRLLHSSVRTVSPPTLSSLLHILLHNRTAAVVVAGVDRRLAWHYSRKYRSHSKTQTHLNSVLQYCCY